MKFDFVFLGQSILKYEVPLEVFVSLNNIYEMKRKFLPVATKQLAGKIKEEVSLFFAGPDSEKMHTHNHISDDLLKWFSAEYNLD